MKTKKVLALGFLVLSLLLFGVSRGAAVEAKSIEDIKREIEQYEKEIVRLGAQADTLTTQINQFNAQIRLTGLKIEETQEKIGLLGGRIDLLEGSLRALSDAFSARASETYKMARLGDPIILLITSQDLSNAVARFHYLQKIQEADRGLLVRLQDAQLTYVSEKTDQESLQIELEDQQAVLGVQKVAKDELLEQTKNDERKYQQLLSQALAERAALEAALVSGVEVGPVSRGDPIGLVGNSGYPGCSTGKHLHFEIRKGNQWVDPDGYMQNKTVNDEQNDGTVAIGSGNWPWPISDTVRLTQHYGQTPYSWRYTYSGGIHTGLDLVSTTSDVIRAPENGTLYKSSQSCGGNIINIIYIDHGDDLISFYLHVQ